MWQQKTRIPGKHDRPSKFENRSCTEVSDHIHKNYKKIFFKSLSSSNHKVLQIIKFFKLMSFHTWCDDKTIQMRKNLVN